MSTYQVDDLEICIATMDREDLSFLKPMFQMEPEEIPYHLIIVNQSKTRTLYSSFPNIRVINDKDYGLSRSRNMAIANCKKQLAWILDDDVELLPDAIDDIIHNVNSSKDCCLYVFKVLDENHNERRSYPNENKNLTSFKSLEGICSIELVINVGQFTTSNLKFDERFGLGAQFPMSEEYLLARDALKKKLQITFLNKSIVIHDAMSTGSAPADNDMVIYTKGAIAAREYSWCTKFFQWKYVFFLWRKGIVNSTSLLSEKYGVFGKGVNDYLSSVE